MAAFLLTKRITLHLPYTFTFIAHRILTSHLQPYDTDLLVADNNQTDN
jgi:hypothetical protein